MDDLENAVDYAVASLVGEQDNTAPEEVVASWPKMAARPSFQQRFAQQQAVIEQQAAAQDQGDYGQTGGEEMAPEGAESQLGNREATTKKIAKELRKLQAKSQVLQEHSRRLHGKALQIQQNQQREAERRGRAAARDAVGHPQAEAAMSSASPEPYMAQGTENRSADGGMSELSYGSAAPAGYGYGGDMQPQMDAALHWNIGGDNRASVRNDAQAFYDGPMGAPAPLQWGNSLEQQQPVAKMGPAAAGVTKRKGGMEPGAGKVNSVAAMHDARSKQVPLNPLRARKGGTGVSANPVIRQQSIADMLQAQHSTHFQDTLRRNSEPLMEEQPQRQQVAMQRHPQVPAHMRHQQLMSEPSGYASDPGLDSFGGNKQQYLGTVVPSGQPQKQGMKAARLLGSKPAGKAPRSAPDMQASMMMYPGMMSNGTMAPLGTGYGYPMPGTHAATQQAGGHQGQGHRQQPMQPVQQAMMGPQMGVGFQGWAGQMPMASGPGMAMAQPGHGQAARKTLRASGQGKGPAAGPQGLPPGYGMPYWGMPGVPMQPVQPMQGQMMPGQMPPTYSMPQQFGMLQQQLPGIQGGPGHIPVHRQAGSSLPPPNASYPTMPMMMGAMGGYQQHMAPQQAAMQQRALEVQQQQMQQFQAMEAFMSQQLMNRQDNTLLRYGNFQNATRKKEPLQDRPEFRTY